MEKEIDSLKHYKNFSNYSKNLLLFDKFVPMSTAQSITKIVINLQK